MSPSIPGNDTKHFRECHETFRECLQTFWGMSPNIPGNFNKHSGESLSHCIYKIYVFWTSYVRSIYVLCLLGCCQTLSGMSPNILGNVLQHSGEYQQTFWGMSSKFPGNVLKHSGQCPQTFRRMSSNNQRILENILGYVVKHPVESIKAFRWMYIIVRDTSDHELYLFVKEPLLLNSTSKQIRYMLHWEIENFGLCFKKEVNQKKGIERKRASLSFFTKNKKLKIFLVMI